MMWNLLPSPLTKSTWTKDKTGQQQQQQRQQQISPVFSMPYTCVLNELWTNSSNNNNCFARNNNNNSSACAQKRRSAMKTKKVFAHDLWGNSNNNNSNINSRTPNNNSRRRSLISHTTKFTSAQALNVTSTTYVIANSRFKYYSLILSEIQSDLRISATLTFQHV